jgi:DNA-binding transcriptional ArsR family regulator
MSVDPLFRGLNHPVRRFILGHLLEEPLGPAAVQRRHPEYTLSQIAHHFRVLSEHGLVILDHTRPRRGALEHIYRLAHEHEDRVRAILSA